jgi:hypothetical protein
MGAKLYRLLSAVFVTIATAAVLVGCSPTVFGLGGEEPAAQPTPLCYVKDGDSLYFICNSVDELTSRIYFESVFVNTSAEHIARATITVEFIDLDKYTLYSSKYDTIADFQVIVKNIPAGGQKRFSIATDIAVTNPDNNIYRLWTYYPQTVGYTKLGVFFYKINYVVGDARPSINEISGGYNFV